MGAYGGGVSRNAAFELGVLYSIGTDGQYWSSTPSPVWPTYAYFMIFNTGGVWLNNTPRTNGFTLFNVN